jgi:coatomer protein complex subunit epsilon
MAEPDLLFTVRNAFYLGAFQSAIAEASDLEGLSDQEKVERDCYVYRSYIELGSYEVRRTYQPACMVACMVLHQPPASHAL